MYQLTKPDNVVEILEKSVSKFPQRPFLGTKNKRLKQYDWITFSDFGKRVDNVRSGLSQFLYCQRRCRALYPITA